MQFRLQRRKFLRSSCHDAAHLLAMSSRARHLPMNRDLAGVERRAVRAALLLRLPLCWLHRRDTADRIPPQIPLPTGAMISSTLMVHHSTIPINR